MLGDHFIANKKYSLGILLMQLKLNLVGAFHA
jgi:hypothetical protein